MRPVYYAILLISLLTIVAADLLLSHHSSAPLPLADISNFTCETSANNKAKLNIQLPMPADLKQLSHQFCESTILAKYYGQIRLSWKPREKISAADILSEDHEMIMGRKHSLQGILPDFDQRFSALTTTVEFPVYWFSFTPIDNLNTSTLTHIKIGLVDDKLSHTHYLIPLRFLASHSDDVGALNIQYFKNTYAMYEAFKKQEVDLISTGDWFEETLPKPFYKQYIANADVAGLFVSRNVPADAKCELFNLMQPMTHHLSQFLRLKHAIMPAGCP